MRRFLSALPALALALATAGCGGGGNDSVPYICPAQTPVIAASGVLVSPANGATGVPASIGQIAFTTNVANLDYADPVVTLTPGNGAPPIRLADVVFTTNGVSHAGVPALQRAVTYTVTLAASPLLAGSAECHGMLGVTLGSFTTQ